MVLALMSVFEQDGYSEIIKMLTDNAFVMCFNTIENEQNLIALLCNKDPKYV